MVVSLGAWRCPGQDMRNWRPGDIFEVACPHCGEKVEFFKDEVKLRCPHCQQTVPNPRLDLGCAAWCAYGSKCLEGHGQNPGQEGPPKTSEPDG